MVEKARGHEEKRANEEILILSPGTFTLLHCVFLLYYVLLVSDKKGNESKAYQLPSFYSGTLPNLVHILSVT